MRGISRPVSRANSGLVFEKSLYGIRVKLSSDKRRNILDYGVGNRIRYGDCGISYESTVILLDCKGGD